MMMTITKQVNIQVLHELTGSDELYVDCQVEKDDENYYMNYYNYYTIIYIILMVDGHGGSYDDVLDWIGKG